MVWAMAYMNPVYYFMTPVILITYPWISIFYALQNENDEICRTQPNDYFWHIHGSYIYEYILGKKMVNQKTKQIGKMGKKMDYIKNGLQMVS